ncbi:MAG: nucleotidyltransferase [Parcubacteria group bacterium Gr01-1014_3]|nr:MAG: nucleotidyltransferase [Parcubacteria group bacterium Gr01-1014_3]
MVPIEGKPLLLHQIEHLKEHGVNDFYINLHYLPEVIKDYFGDGSKFGVKITYSYEPELLGTAGGLKKFEKYLRDSFFVVYGDVFNEINYSDMRAYYEKKQPAIGVHVIAKNDHPHDSDLAVLDKDMRFTAIYRKPHKEMPKTDYFGMEGIYLFNKKILKYIPDSGVCAIDHDLLPDIISKGEKYYGYLAGVDDYVHDIGTHERYSKAQERKKSGN